MFRLIYPIFRGNRRIFSQKYVQSLNVNARNCTVDSRQESNNDVIDDIKDHKMKGKTVEKIDKETLELLQRLSLVNIEDEDAIQAIQDAVEFASQILDIDTEGVEPMYTVLEGAKQKLRDDIPFTENTQEAILANAAVKEEGYFVAPPGNIPLDTEVFNDPEVKKEKS